MSEAGSPVDLPDRHRQPVAPGRTRARGPCVGPSGEAIDGGPDGGAYRLLGVIRHGFPPRTDARMPKHLAIAIPHNLGAAEVRRRLDRHTDWAIRRLERESISVVAGAWSDDARAFSASRFGLKARGGVRVSDDSLHLEATVPWTVGVFATALEAVAQRYAARLLSAEGAT